MAFEEFADRFGGAADGVGFPVVGRTSVSWDEGEEGGRGEALCLMVWK
jgi:hypothetical protein